MNAFPIHQLVQDRYDNYSLHCEGGLTKRELFAAMAMQGLLASGTVSFAHMRAAAAVELADALLAELAKDGAP